MICRSPRELPQDTGSCHEYQNGRVSFTPREKKAVEEQYLWNPSELLIVIRTCRDVGKILIFWLNFSHPNESSWPRPSCESLQRPRSIKPFQIEDAACWTLVTLLHQRQDGADLKSLHICPPTTDGSIKTSPDNAPCILNEMKLYYYWFCNIPIVAHNVHRWLSKGNKRKNHHQNHPTGLKHSRCHL